jgi:hypothetical protein
MKRSIPFLTPLLVLLTMLLGLGAPPAQAAQVGQFVLR